MENWQVVGSTSELSKKSLQQIEVSGTKIALSYQDGEFHAISGVCNHVGGPLGSGTLEGDYVVCPWHYFKFHRKTGEGEPGYEKDKVPSFKVKVEAGEVLVDLSSKTSRGHIKHEPHPLSRKPERAPGPLRIAGLSTTVMDLKYPRPSTSEMLLEQALEHAKANGFETHLHKLRDLKFRHCEGFYSKSSHACTWPCSVTQLDENDQLDRVYEDIVHWADVILIATPIRWGAASSLYFKMAERLNCIQNQITTHGNQLLKNKVAGFIITGGQDNIQSVAGQMMGFFSELGFHLPPFPFIAHSLGWTAENMERNVRHVEKSEALREASRELVDRCAGLSHILIQAPDQNLIQRAGRKAFNPLADQV
ncbi:MAG: Rieske 2Fe-2S domain-containing protein [Bdellovibrionota bacterium]